MNKLLLNIAMLPSGIWRSLGADTLQLRAILQAKLTIDDRKPLSFGNNKGVEAKKKKDRKYTSLVTMLLSLFMGFIYMLPILMVYINPLIGLTLFYTMFMFFFIFLLITDFSNVLVDTKEKHILFSRPVSDKTIVLSRLLYIGIYLFRIGIPMSLPAWIIFALAKGWQGALWFPFPLVLSVFVILFLVCGLYLLILKISGPEKFKDTLNYFQIGFSMVFFAVWMLSSRMINYEAIEGLDIKMFDWARYVPSYWIAASWTWIEPTVNALSGTLMLSILAVLFPIACLWLTIKFLAPQFVKSISGADNIEPTVVKATPSKHTRTGNTARVFRYAHLLNRNDTAKAGFILTWVQTARSRSFKMRVLPTYAYVPVYFVYFLMSNNTTFAAFWEELPSTKNHIGLLYMTTMVVMQAIAYLSMSEQYKASWVYYSSPVDRPGHLLTGALKAVWLKYYLPFVIAVGMFVVYVWGWSAVPDIILATLNITLFLVVVMRFSNKTLPFSTKEQMKERGVKSVLRLLLILVLIGGLGFGHAFAAITWWLKLLFIALSSILLWLLYDSLYNLSWNNIKNTEE